MDIVTDDTKRGGVILVMRMNDTSKKVVVATNILLKCTYACHKSYPPICYDGVSMKVVISTNILCVRF